MKIFFALLVAGCVGVAAAGETLPGLRKLMDTPLRDTSLCRGPDGTWYLTGTVEPFWKFNEGIKVWKSADLTNWVELGFVWKYGESPWHKPYLAAKKPLWAPEIHFLKGTFWLTYSLPGWKAGDPKGTDAKNSGCGLLKSTSGRAEGPYVDVQPNERLGDEIDASLFQDDDGEVYFLWHSGKIARMKPDMSGLAEPYHWLRMSESDPSPKHHAGLCAGIFGKGSFDHVGFEGMFLFKANGRYYLDCSDVYDGRYSCMIATATNLFGPYGARYEALPHCGHNMFFRDERGQWWSSYFGSDGKAPWRERAAILPVEFAADGRVRPAGQSREPAAVDAATMQRIYDEVKTPFKYGVVIKGEDSRELVDCPSIFRRDGQWYMMYVAISNKVGYQTFLARSDDLLHWQKLGRVLSFGPTNAWDAWQADGGIALCDHRWDGSHELGTVEGKYWLSYIGGALQGYETDPLSIGMAWTTNPAAATEWQRVPENPVLTPRQPDARSFETKTLYKSQIIHDTTQTLGWPFVMFYNGKCKDGFEQIGMAVSRDMVRWQRHGNGSVIVNGAERQRGISGDPQLVKIGDVWVMFYFGAHWQPKAFDTFACSRDLVHWTKWDGPHLIEPSAPFDATYAHKPWVLKWNGVVYHFYCAVGDQGRVIALATSRDLQAAPTGK